MTTLAVPGQPLSSSETPQASFAPGPGTFLRDGTVFSSTLGQVDRSGGLISVLGKSGAQAIPEPGAVAVGASLRHVPSRLPASDRIEWTGTVTRINSQAATLSLLTIDDKPCRPDYQGVIRAQDVRATNKDGVKVFLAFRPADVVRAKVISLGDARSYYLSTAENRLGVLFAVSAKTGATLEPVSWEQMRDPTTGELESRKCAGPD